MELSNQDTKTECVYFIEAENGWIKIGYTKSIRERFLALRLGSPIPLQMLRAFECDGNHKQIEKKWHKLFASKRQHGEWFRLNERDKERILSSAEWPDIDISELNTNVLSCEYCEKHFQGLKGLNSHKWRCNKKPARSEDK